MKLRFLGLMSLAMAVCLAPALMAQDEGQGRGQRGQRGGQRGGGPGGFGRGGFGGGQQNGAMQLIGLLRIEEVRKEVGMAEETWTAVQEQMPQMPRPNPGEGREGMREAFEKYRTATEEFEPKAQGLLDEVLEPKGQERLMGLLIQQSGYPAATNVMIAKKIGLDAAGIEKVQEAAGEARQAMAQEFRGGRGGGEEGGRRGGGPGGFDPERMRELMEQMREKTDEAVAGALTKEQVATLDKLKGEKFEFPERRFGFGVGPGGRPGGAGGRPGGGGEGAERGGRGGGGRPRGGGRPGSDN